MNLLYQQKVTSAVRKPYGTFSTGRKAAKAQTKRKMIDAACEVILNVGAHAMTVDRLVVEAGVSRGTFYQHFQSREDVLATLRLELTSRIDDHYAVLIGLDSSNQTAYQRWLLDLIDICRKDRKVILALICMNRFAGAASETRAYYDLLFQRLATGLKCFADAREVPLLRARALLLFMQIESVIRYFVANASPGEEGAFIEVVAAEIYCFVNGRVAAK